MSNGVLGKSMSNAGNYVNPYTVPSGISFATININVCNTDANDTKVRIAISTSAAPSTADFIEKDVVVPASGVLERTCILVSPGEKVFVYAENSSCSIRVHGLEQSATV